MLRKSQKKGSGFIVTSLFFKTCVFCRTKPAQSTVLPPSNPSDWAVFLQIVI
ncbi:hypothetical protein BMETH_1536_0 [methanotrophic bacterial endosymbiont of Bathymodiolus sp.]|nr:hypothetical protein BMETH_1536_0 [methanotrophic bacterial endosymbiont of Bathymodiolus sp.]